MQLKVMLNTCHISLAPAAALDMLNSRIILANSQDAMLEMLSSCMGNQVPRTKVSSEGAFLSRASDLG